MKTKSKSIVLAVWAMTALLAGCQSGNQPTTEQPAEQPATKQAGAAKSGAPKRRPASTEARAETVTVPAGTTLAVRLSNTIDTARASSGDACRAAGREGSRGRAGGKPRDWKGDQRGQFGAAESARGTFPGFELFDPRRRQADRNFHQRLGREGPVPQEARRRNDRRRRGSGRVDWSDCRQGQRRRHRKRGRRGGGDRGRRRHGQERNRAGSGDCAHLHPDCAGHAGDEKTLDPSVWGAATNAGREGL